MDKPRRRAKIVLRAGGGSRHQLNISGCSESAPSEADTMSLHSLAQTHYDHSSWAAPVINHTNEDLGGVIRTRNELKKEIFGQTFAVEGSHSYPLHSTPLHTQLVAKHHKLHTNTRPRGTSRMKTNFPGSVSSGSSEYEEPDYYANSRHGNMVYPEIPSFVQSNSYAESHDYESNFRPVGNHGNDKPRIRHKNERTRTTRNDYADSSTDSYSSPLHYSTRAKSGDERVNLTNRKLSSSSKRGKNRVHPGNITLLDSQSDQSSSPLTQNKLFEFESSPRKGVRLFSTTDSISSNMSTTLTPLLTASLRKGGRKPSGSACFDFDAEGQLESCFPDRQLQVFVVTWNMQEQKLLPDCLDDLLLPLSQEKAADMFVIGTQESTPSRREWEVLLQQTLGPSYVLVQSASLGVIYLTLYLRRDLIWFCSAVCSSSYATRPGTLIKTKGGVGLSFTLFGTSILFVTSHFTAHDHKVQERNSDMQRIATNLSLSVDSGDIGSVLSTFDHVFWFGDLNYRVEMEREQAEHYVDSSDWMALLLKDQLTREILQGNVFEGFSEQPISFPPSYKFDTNSDDYDSSEKKRVPSWTDRILFKSFKKTGIVGCCYNICKSLRISDHRPVYAVFRVQLEPSKHIEGIPETIVTFDRETYIRAQKRRRQLAEEMASQRTVSEEVDGPPSSRHVTSSVCVII